MKRRGFTLIEILVSTAIFAVITTIVFIDFASQSNRTALNLAVQQLNTDLQDMLNNSQAGVVFDAIGKPPLGYGISFTLDTVTPANNTSYTEFADKGVGDPLVADKQYTDSSELLLTKNLPPKTMVNRISDATLTYSRVDLTYSLPGSRLAAYGISGVQPMAQIITPIHIQLKNARLNTCQELVLVPGQPTITIQNITCS